MKYALLEIKLMSPALLHARNVKSYFLSTEDFIPSQTLRGAVIDALIKEGYDVHKLEEIFVSPGYPSNSAPAHPFVFAMGRKSEEFKERKDSLVIEGDVEDIINRKRREIEEIMRDKKVMRRNDTLKSKTGTVVSLEGTLENSLFNYKEVKIPSIIQGHVAINKVTMNKESGMLYHYEYKMPTTFWALSSNTIPKEEIRITLGRSKNRGFGEALLTRKGELELADAKNGWAYCLSPCYTDVETGIGKVTNYTGWFTSDDLRGTKPFMKVAIQGSLLKVKGELYPLKTAGLNFAFSLSSLGELLSKVRL